MREASCQIISSKITRIHQRQHWAFSDNGNDHERTASNYSVRLLSDQTPYKEQRSGVATKRTIHTLALWESTEGSLVLTPQSIRLSFCSYAPQQKNVNKVSHQNIVPKSHGSRLIRNHPAALSCHTFLAVLAQSIPFWPFCTYLHLERTKINISLLSLALSSLSNCPHVSSIYSSTMVDNHDGWIEYQRENVSL